MRGLKPRGEDVPNDNSMVVIAGLGGCLENDLCERVVDSI